MRYFWDLILHFICAHSRHGTHSPFVYRLADEVIYAAVPVASKKTFSRVDKEVRLMAEIAAFFDVRVQQEFSSSSDDEAALLLDLSLLNVEELVEWQKIYRFIIVKDMYRSASNKQKWGTIMGDIRIGICIDLFHIGLIFYRREQLKENFKLRFPYWKY